MDWRIDTSCLDIMEKIGSGSFGVVKRARWRHTEVAIKVLYDDAMTDDKALFEKEVKIMSTLHHPNIVQFLGFCKIEQELALVIEFFPEGSIEQFVPREKPPPKTALRFCNEMALAIEYLHSRKPLIVIHRDIKPANFLLTASRRVKLGDFGVARTPKTAKGSGSSNSLTSLARALELSCSSGNPKGEDPCTVIDELIDLTSNCGTARYMAPEVASQDGSKNKYNSAADIFSLAMCYYFIWERTPPAIPGHTTPATYLAALNAGRRPAFSKTPKTIRELINCMWHSDPAARFSAEQVLNYLVDLEISSSLIPGRAEKVTHKSPSHKSRPLARSPSYSARTVGHFAFATSPTHTATTTPPTPTITTPPSPIAA